jgi:hypothetical protein
MLGECQASLKLALLPLLTKASTKHAPSLGLSLLRPLLYVLDCALKCSSYMEPYLH